MEERRRIDRVGYQAKSIVVVCDSGESIFVETCNVSPLGIAFTMPAGSPDLKGKDIIIVADTMIMYADVITDSMREAIDETNRRREIQDAYNKAHGIVPKTIKKDVRDLISVTRVIDSKDTRMEKDMESMNADELKKEIADVTKQMKKAAADLNFELAAQLRDRMVELKKHLHEVED